MSLQTAAVWVVAIGIFLITVKPLGTYIARVFAYEPTFLDKPMRPIENAIFRLFGIDPSVSMTAKQYGLALILTNFAWIVIAYILLRVQGHLPWNPQHMGAVNPQLAFNTATSFGTNTNWQAYSGENTLSYFSQFGNLSFLQFVTPAVGGTMLIAFIRAISGKKMGNFFVDLVLMSTRILLPLAIVFTVLLVWQGVPETLAPYLHVHTITGQTQVVPRGPIASWESIEHLGTNGGGFTNANSANPLENPTPLSNLFEVVMMGLVEIAFFYALGVMTGKKKLAWTLIGVAGVLYLAMGAMIYFPMHLGSPILNALGLHGHVYRVGTELRLGSGGTSLFGTSTMAFTTGSVATAHDSALPIAGLSFMIGMFLNLVFGGYGVGLLNMLMLVIITVFIMGLMVGRTPEFLGKKIEAKEVSLASIAFLLHPFIVLVGVALSVALPAGLKGVYNPGPHGFSEILYGILSGAANNGSAFGGLGAALPYYEVTIGIVMVLGRFASVMAMFLLAESLLQKRQVPTTSGTMRTEGLLFGGILVGAVMVLNALTFFPVVALGPLAEHYLLIAHHLF
ncbi:MAG: potassium-transporting ATPase subunit KdpA [Firmicutes bacterium]|nr:potassium-transporting ATPase subunit KdpA [Bacillota bacterium]